MVISFVNSFKSEWIKRKRSAASWLTIIGGFFIPAIMIAALLLNFESTYSLFHSGKVWDALFMRSWHSMAIFLLPMGVILATSLITQLEFKNNTWKQLHTVPQKLSTIFLSKLAVILVMMLQLFVLFNIGIYLTGLVPSLVFRAIPYPVEAIDYGLMLKWNSNFFLDCLPIIALQYLMGLQFKNFLIPLGVGLGLFISCMIALSWKYCYLIPYTYCTLNFMKKASPVPPGINIHYWALGYFAVFIIAGYLLYINKKEKG